MKKFMPEGATTIKNGDFATTIEGDRTTLRHKRLSECWHIIDADKRWSKYPAALCKSTTDGRERLLLQKNLVKVAPPLRPQV